ncbi:PilC/PilY family type IV pilus protein [Aquabacterium sp. A7-Y]|uniref:pilus assembly protein n=1 Tax=Aquabacterium sp. A7-Y TaxID=1349605 RepID=UPI00223D143D|nr:PilC/PilY family type IV pilus protein [Aquabacterium sp. A7-Y]MCW7539174.1 PilC/PilY family type IV pilus protein [Aquabacterium sp. A7-Y]
MSKLKKIVCSLLIVALTPLPQAAWATTTLFNSTSMNAVPPNIAAEGTKPMMMIAASRDHTLFAPIYTDYEDIDGDNVIDFTFKPTYKYYGYFDATKCYTYDTSNNRFNPSALAVVSTNRYTCTGSTEWSGNFLNWATMTRLDVVRKMLYGGKRSTDTVTDTVLERANLSQDSHSFVKFYAGTDIDDYTPYSVSALTKSGNYYGLTICNRSSSSGSGGNPVIRLAKGNYSLWATIGGTVCRWKEEGTDRANFGGKVRGYFRDSALGGATVPGTATALPHESTIPSNQASADGAVYSGVGPELTVRVKVCVPSLLGEEQLRCKAYGSNHKPFGLLQEFGLSETATSAARSEFGMITGSYDSNLQFGALRKNMGSMNNEIDATTGRFCHLGGCGDVVKGAIAALDSVVLYGASAYDTEANGGLTWALPSEMTNGRFPAWGNPMGEMIVQSLRYYAGLATPSPATTRDAALGMPTGISWQDPLTDTAARRSAYGNAVCRPMNVLAISSGALSYDTEAGTWFEGGGTVSALPNRSRGDLAQYTNVIGAQENLNNTLRSVGSVSGDFGQDCSGKTLTNLASVTGICPEAPGVKGSYLAAGAALYANTSNIKTLSAAERPSDLPSTALKVKTYAASLAGGVARIEVKIPGTNRFVYITPESAWNMSAHVSPQSRKDKYPGQLMPGAMLTFRTLSASATHGAFVVTWNDAQFGGDYDMDIVGFLRYDIIGSNELQITTDILNVDAGAKGSHGFSVIGTNADGRYLTHGINTFADAGDCTNSSARSNRCTFVNAGIGSSTWDQASSYRTQTRTFTMSGVENVMLRDPLWYVAKYGSFDSKNATLPTNPDTWDVRRNDGQTCGGSTGRACSDGEPDGYFLARRPELLERQLRETLEQIVAASNAAPAVSSSQLQTNSFKYVAEFEPASKSGTVRAYRLLPSGDFTSTTTWDAGANLTTATNRQVITNDLTADGPQGLPFNWDNLSQNYKNAIVGVNLSGLPAAERAEKETWGDQLVDFVRGDRTNEASSGKFRVRNSSNIMGTVVNSSPWIQTRPSARFLASQFDADTPSYFDFVVGNGSRRNLLWVGANDGMLHAFKADGADDSGELLTDVGDPVLSYVPSPLANRLRLSADYSTTIDALMDGSPYTGDVLIGTGESREWKTYLFSSLGRGGRAVFALDVTSLSNLTETGANNVFKWMMTSTDDPDLGHVLSEATLHTQSRQASPIMHMNNGKFGVLVPNGYGSTSGKAVLFILSAEGPGTGAWSAGGAQPNYYKLDTGVTGNNGLMGATWVDKDNNGTADIVYATDLRGNLWKFDISSSDPSQWKSAFRTSTGVAEPLFKARDGSTELPFTTAPAISFPPFGGTMVVAGTGRALLSGDFPSSNRANRMYGIWDRREFSTTPRGRALPQSISTLARRQLQRQTDGTLRVTSGSAIDWTTQDGWYLDFPATGSGTGTSEMVLSNPELREGTIAFTTVRPADASQNLCFRTPPASLYLVDPVTGLPNADTLGSYTVTDPDGTTRTVYVVGVASADQRVRIVRDGSTRSTGTNGEDRNGDGDKDDAGEAPQPGACPAGFQLVRVVGRGEERNLCFSANQARIQWREIPGLKTY